MGEAMEQTVSENVTEILAVTKHLEFDADIERVWDAITDPDSIARWFPDAVEIDDFAPGHRGTFVWKESDCGHRFQFEVEELVPNERVVWRWARDADTELEQTVATRVEWVLTPRVGGGTVLDLRESGFESEGDLSGNDEGWDRELGELADYLNG